MKNVNQNNNVNGNMTVESEVSNVVVGVKESELIKDCLETGGESVLEILDALREIFLDQMETTANVLNIPLNTEVSSEDGEIDVIVDEDFKEMLTYQYNQYDAVQSLLRDEINWIETEYPTDEAMDEEFEYIPIRKLLNSAILNAGWVGFEGDSEFTIDDEPMLGCWAFLAATEVNDVSNQFTLDDEIPVPDKDTVTNIDVVNDEGVLCEVEFRY